MDHADSEFGRRSTAADVFVARWEELRRVAAGSGLSPPDAEDALQDVYLQAVDRPPRHGTDEQVFHWLVRLTMNRCLLRHRQRSREQRALRMIGLLGVSRVAALAEDRPAALDEEARVRRALRALPAELVAPLVLHYFCEFSSAVVAEIIGVPLGTIHRRLFEARRRLADVLGEEDVG